MKKVLTIILFIAVLTGGIIGTVYFWNQNKNSLEQVAQLTQQNAAVQAQIDAIGEMTSVYEVSRNVYSGAEILESDLTEVSIPVSTLADSSITDMADLVGKYYRVNVAPGTILSKDMLMDEEGEIYKFPIDMTLSSLPISTVVGDYLDIRMLLPNGEEYPVLTHKKVERLYETTVTFYATEEENMIYLSMLQDIGQHSGTCIFYATKFLEPGNNYTIAYYPVAHEMENAVLFNPNILDTTRCINTNLRNHIDEVLQRFSNSDNQQAAQSWIQAVTAQLNGQIAAQQAWIESQKQEASGNGKQQEQMVDAYGEPVDPNFQQQLTDAMDTIDEKVKDVEAIE